MKENNGDIFLTSSSPFCSTYQETATAELKETSTQTSRCGVDDSEVKRSRR